MSAAPGASGVGAAVAAAARCCAACGNPASEGSVYMGEELCLPCWAGLIRALEAVELRVRRAEAGA